MIPVGARLKNDHSKHAICYHDVFGTGNVNEQTSFKSACKGSVAGKFRANGHGHVTLMTQLPLLLQL